jgi:hypothetical protein
MAKENKNVTVNTTETKEETNMAVNANVVTEQQAAPVVEQAQQPVVVPVATEAGTQVPAEVQKVPLGTRFKTFFKEKVAPVASNVAKVGVGILIGVVGAKVIDAVTDSKLEKAYEPDNSPEPDYNPDNDLGDSGGEEVSEES